MEIQKLVRLKFVICNFCFLISFFSYNNLFGQCDSNYFSITTTASQQTINGIIVSILSPTNAQSTRLLNGFVTGYYIGDENSTEEINFSLSQSVIKIRIKGRALSAAYNKIEYFTLGINGQHHFIKPAELITPDPAYGEKCFLQPNGTIMGDTLRDGNGSFILTYENLHGITSFKIKDSISSLNPEGAIYDVQIYTKCNRDTSVISDNPKFYIATAFTPNNDGKNDFFKPILSGNLIRFEFRVFNRLGQNIFSSVDLNKEWDGTYLGQTQETGIFVWSCYYQVAGQSLQIRKGTVLLIR